MSPYVDGEFREPVNRDRAGWAQVGLEAYAAENRTDAAEQLIIRPGDGRREFDEDDREHLEEVASDFVCDLMHLCKEAGVLWEVVEERAETNYLFEVEEEADMEEDSER